MATRTLIVGIGNYIMSDDAAGVHAIEAMRNSFVFPEDVELIDGGTKGIELLPFLEDADRMMLIDAVDMGTAPGTVRVIEEDGLRAIMDLKFSVHQIGIPDMLFALEFKGIKPPQMCLVGIQPQSLEMGTEMSPPVNGAFGRLLDMALERLARWDIRPAALDGAMDKENYRYVPGNTLKNNRA